MGNQLIKGNCCEAQTVYHNEHQKYNAINPHYIQDIDFFENVSKNIPQYKNQNHTKLVNYLRQKKLTFEDNYFPLDRALGTEFPFSPKWKRICEVYPGCQISQNNDFKFSYMRNEHSFAKDNFVIAMQHLMKYPTLLNKIFPIKQIRDEGFYSLYFGLSGSFRDRTEVVIDDYIPLDRKFQYLFGKPNKNIIWMILVEKALAKVLRSYNAIKNLTSAQIFEEVTGVPLLNSHQIIFHENYYLNSNQIQFAPEESIFFKFTIDKSIQIAFLIWQDLDEISNHPKFDCSPLVMELINEEKASRLLYVNTLKRNKLILSGKENFYPLEKGTYVIHIYNRFYLNINRNLLIYASQRVDIHLRREAHFEELKRQAIFNSYKQIHNSIRPLHDEKDLSARLFWDGHRAILCLKNESKQQKMIEIRIEGIYQKQIIFEQAKNKKVIIEKCNGNKHIYVYFLRRKDHQIGRFYKINVLK